MRKYTREEIQSMTSKERAKLQDELLDAFNLMNSDEWKVFISFVKNRALLLQEDVNDAVQKGDMTAAAVALGILKDSRKLPELFKGVMGSISTDLKTVKEKEQSNG